MVVDKDEMQATRDREASKGSGMQEVNVPFSPEAYKTVEELAARKGKTVAETLRDAIAMEKWIEEQRRSGARLLIERNGRLSEVIAG